MSVNTILMLKATINTRKCLESKELTRSVGSALCDPRRSESGFPIGDFQIKVILLRISRRIGDDFNPAPVGTLEKEQQPGGVDGAVMLMMEESADVKAGIVNGVNPADV